MNKSELIKKAAKKTDLTVKQTEDALDAIIETITEALIEDDKVKLVGFGTFETRERAARQGRNPRDPQQIIDIPASKTPAFKASKTLKDLINPK